MDQGPLQGTRGPYKRYEIDDTALIPKRTKNRHVSTTITDIIEPKYQPQSLPAQDISSESHNMYLQETAILPYNERCLAVLAFINKMHLTGTASEHLLRLLRLFGSTDMNSSSLKLNDCANDIPIKRVDYCNECGDIFPEDEDIYICSNGCGTLRFIGTAELQQQKRPKFYFTTASMLNQLKEIATRNSVVDKISLTLNTDGVPLYSSSSVNLWPVFLVINELPPASRFLEENMVVWGIWQGTGKPVFKTFFQPLVTELNDIHKNHLQVNDKEIPVSLNCITMDLQAKSQVLEMVAHNGQFPCVTCEVEGKVIKKGKGHAKCFPVSDEAQLRTVKSMLDNAEEALENNRHVRGVKSVSILFDINGFNPIEGTVPEYMHGVLLGATKKLMSLWFGSVSTGQPYHIGRKVQDVDMRLANMRPTDDLSRLPRSIEKDLNHWKASEFQHWLLYYSIPCLIGILPTQYLDNLCLLVQGIYKLLGEKLDDVDLNDAELVLAQFQISFENLYGLEHCGLNIHNIGSHLTYYCRLHGPLWAWSCFSFEDMNGVLTRTAHGTGNVTKQLLECLMTHKKLHTEVNKVQDTNLREFTIDMLTTGKRPSVTMECTNAKLLGKLVPTEAFCEEIHQVTKCSANAFLIKRVQVRGQLIAALAYTRMKKRHCGTVRLEDGSYGTVNSLVYDSKSGLCFAEINMLEVDGYLHSDVDHLLLVKDSGRRSFVPINDVTEKVLLLEGNKDAMCIARLANHYKHCV